MVFVKIDLGLLKKYKYQILATLAVNIFSFSHGNATAWLAPTLPLLQSVDSPLNSGPLTIAEASWLGSLVCLGGLIGSFGSGMLVNLIGRKKSLYLMILPHLSFWLMIMFGTEVSHLFLGRILSGITGGGVFVIIPTFVADIADNKIRGTLGSMLMIFFNAGILSGFILGSYLSYSLFPRIIIGWSIVFMVAIYRFPDSPQYLLQRKKEAEAEDAAKFYRNFNAETKEECLEFREYFANLKNRICGNVNDKIEEVSYRDYFSPACIRGMCVGLGIMFLNQFSGLFALVTYTVNIFESSGSSLDPNFSTIIIGVIQLLGTFFAAHFVDRLGRKPLLITSCLGVTIGSFALAIYSFLSLHYDLTQFSWIAVCSVSITIFLGSVGLTPLPVVVLAEILPQKVKPVCVTICMCSLTMMAFTVLKVYPVAIEAIGIYGVMGISGGITAIGAATILFFMPETKGKCLEINDQAS